MFSFPILKSPLRFSDVEVTAIPALALGTTLLHIYHNMNAMLNESLHSTV